MDIYNYFNILINMNNKLQESNTVSEGSTLMMSGLDGEGEDDHGSGAIPEWEYLLQD